MTSEIYTITFLRHGESVGNVEERFQGQADFPLTDTGVEQARALAARWQAEGRNFDRCLASPLLRARQTAEIVAGALNLPLEFDPDWKEVDNGRLAGLTHEEGKAQVPEPEFSTPYTRWGVDGESRWELYLRAGRAVQRILDREPGVILVVSHGAILNMAMYALLSIPVQAHYTGPRFMFHNTTFATFTYDPQHHTWRLLHFDDRSHWKED
jgi:2,3-bisphosphoglycerate-dependent phosphoglycerate mutase